jgi:hypothetical protein
MRLPALFPSRERFGNLKKIGIVQQIVARAPLLDRLLEYLLRQGADALRLQCGLLIKLKLLQCLRLRQLG